MSPTAPSDRGASLTAALNSGKNLSRAWQLLLILKPSETRIYTLMTRAQSASGYCSSVSLPICYSTATLRPGYLVTVLKQPFTKNSNIKLLSGERGEGKVTSNNFIRTMLPRVLSSMITGPFEQISLIATLEKC